MRTPLEVDIIMKVIQVKKDTETKIRNKLKEYQNMQLKSLLNVDDEWRGFKNIPVPEDLSKEITKDTCKKLGI